VRRLRRFEAGSNVTLRTLERIAAALDVSVLALLESPPSRGDARRGRPPRRAAVALSAEHPAPSTLRFERLAEGHDTAACPIPEMLRVIDAARVVVVAPAPATLATSELRELVAALAALDRARRA
jgi:hypothetical protein